MGRVSRVAVASCGAPVVRMPARRGLLPVADVPDRERRDGGPELVVGCKDAWLVSRRRAMPVLARRRDEIGEPVEELKRQEFDDAIGSRPRGLLPTTAPDPVGGPNGAPASGEHVADAGDAQKSVTCHGEPFYRKGRPGTVPQQVFEALKIARHVAVY